MTRRASVRKRGRVAPTSAMICGAESTPKPGTSAQALHRVVVGREQVGHLRIELAEMVFDHPRSSSRMNRASDSQLRCRSPSGITLAIRLAGSPQAPATRTTDLRSRGRGQRVLEAEGVALRRLSVKEGVDVDALDLTAGTTSSRPHDIAAFVGGLMYLGVHIGNVLPANSLLSVPTQDIDDVAGFHRQLPPSRLRGVHSRLGTDALEHARGFEQPAER